MSRRLCASRHPLPRRQSPFLDITTILNLREQFVTYVGTSIRQYARPRKDRSHGRCKDLRAARRIENTSADCRANHMERTLNVGHHPVRLDERRSRPRPRLRRENPPIHHLEALSRRLDLLMHSFHCHGGWVGERNRYEGNTVQTISHHP